MFSQSLGRHGNWTEVDAGYSSVRVGWTGSAETPVQRDSSRPQRPSGEDNHSVQVMLALSRCKEIYKDAGLGCCLTVSVNPDKVTHMIITEVDTEKE